MLYKDMMKRCIQCMLVILLACYSHAQLIHTTYSIDAPIVQDLVKISDPGTIILINIDQTIITSKSKMFRYNNNPYRTFIQDLIFNTKNTPVLNKALSTFLRHRQVMLVEPAIPDFIEKLKNTGALVFGLYQTTIDERKVIKNSEEWHYQELQSLAINFTERVNNKDIIILGPKNSHTLFYKGILFTGALSKDGALIELMRVTNIVPRKVIVFDCNIEDLRRAIYSLRLFDIEYYPIQYLAERKLEGIPNADIVRLQQDSLILNNVWLEDDEAEKLLQPQLHEAK